MYIYGVGRNILINAPLSIYSQVLLAYNSTYDVEVHNGELWVDVGKGGNTIATWTDGVD